MAEEKVCMRLFKVLLLCCEKLGFTVLERGRVGNSLANIG